jgi:hypothetical protein
MLEEFNIALQENPFLVILILVLSWPIIAVGIGIFGMIGLICCLLGIVPGYREQ